MKRLKKFLPIFLLVITSTCCAAHSLNIDWDGIPIQSLPFRIEAADSCNMDSIREAIRNAPRGPMAAIFTPNLLVNERLYSGSAIDSTAKFYKRLPDRYGFKVVIFAFLNQDDYDAYPAYSIQTIDCHNRCVDKMVICSLIPGGCEWKRHFVCLRNGKIVVTDSAKVWSSDDGSEENPCVVYSRANVFMYTINPHGRFVRWYPQKSGMINKRLREECADSFTDLFEERGRVNNHLREGYWLIARKYTGANAPYYIPQRIYYRQGVEIKKEKARRKRR